MLPFAKQMLQLMQIAHISSLPCMSAGTAVLIVQPLLIPNGYCVNSKSSRHIINLSLSRASDGVFLDSIILSSLRLSGALELNSSPITSLTQNIF